MFLLTTSKPRTWTTRIRSKVALFVFGLALGVSLVEVGLRIAEELTQRNRFSLDAKYLLSDARLGYRIAPNAPGHDANGFRNAAVPSHAEIVALGDSQTWGLNAEQADAWPQALARANGRSIYSMGVLGYGPVQYLVLTPQALDFSPRVVVIGLYLGNDLYDAYHTVYSGALYRDLQTTNETINQLTNDQMTR